MSPSAFAKKHQRYSAFYDSKAYCGLYDTFPLILTVVPNADRLETLRKVIAKADATDLQWLFTTADHAQADPVGIIWVGKDKKPVSLV